ncbi:hypothetical protein FRC17_003273 [Serendipita sp. 399]|nr:hypothetical protein FRC17_003273 [Serendipita sp. 399]
MSVTLKRKRQEGDDSLELAPKRAHKTSKDPNISNDIQVAGTSSGVVGAPSKTAQTAGENEDSIPNQVTDGGEKVKQKEKQTVGTRSIPTKGPLKRRPKITKLAPQRPYPTVPTSSSATGPKSKRKEGNNKICVTRRTTLGAYLSQCRNLFVKQGYTELYLSAMGAAIPHAVMLATSLPDILPFDTQEIKTSITTGSVKILDEVIPVDEDDEGGLQARIKPSIEIIIRVVSETGMSLNDAKQKLEQNNEDSFSD